MRRALVLMALVAVVAVGGATVYEVTARERDYRALLARGDAAFAADATFEAIESFSGALALRPDSMLAHLRRGETYLRRNDLDDAARDFRAASSLDPTATRPLEQWGEVLYRQQRYRRAAEIFEGRLKLDERSAPIHYRLALARYRDANLEGAIAAANQALQFDNRLAEAFYVIGLSRRDQARGPEAIAALERAVALAPGFIEAREELSELYERSSRGNDAVKQLEALASLDRDRTERRINVALAHARLGRTELAVATLARIVEEAPDQMPAYAALGRVWLQIAVARPDRVDALGKALEALERASSAASATSDTKTDYGRALLMSGQIEAAERVLQQATERYPASDGAFELYAEVAEKQQHYQAARAALLAYNALTESDTDSVGYALRVAELSLRVHDTAAAETWFNRAAHADPEDIRPLLGLVECEIARQNREGALAALSRARDIAPADPQVLALARRLR